MTAVKEHDPAQGTILTGAPTRRLTDEEIRRGLAALARARAFREQLRAQRGGETLPSSAGLIRAAREERSERL